MNAMILAGGMSTRLYPLTKQVPKPLVPVAGAPNAAHLIRYLASYGFTDIAINVHYLAQMIREQLGDGSAFGVRLHYSYEPQLLGSAGGVKKIETFFGGEPFVVVGCDDLTDLPLDALVTFHKSRNALATIGLVERDEVDQYGVVITDGQGKIVEFQEKPPKGTEKSRLANTGIYAFSPEIFQHIGPGFVDFGKDVFPALQRAACAFYGFDARGAYWRDIGTPHEYRQATNDVLRGIVKLPGTRAVGADPSARIGTNTHVDGDVRVGARAEVDGARIVGPSVIGDDVVIGRNAVVERSILWQGVVVGDDALVRDSIVGTNYRIEPGARIVDAIVANEPEPVPT